MRPSLAACGDTTSDQNCDASSGPFKSLSNQMAFLLNGNILGSSILRRRMCFWIAYLSLPSRRHFSTFPVKPAWHPIPLSVSSVCAAYLHDLFATMLTVSSLLRMLVPHYLSSQAASHSKRLVKSSQVKTTYQQLEIFSVQWASNKSAGTHFTHACATIQDSRGPLDAALSSSVVRIKLENALDISQTSPLYSSGR